MLDERRVRWEELFVRRAKFVESKRIGERNLSGRRSGRMRRQGIGR
jgi:hypothetical protein